MESANDLQKKLETYQNQLNQVKELLAVDPDNDQFVKLEEDLCEVIKLTEDLIEHQQNTIKPTHHPPKPQQNHEEEYTHDEAETLRMLPPEAKSASGKTSQTIANQSQAQQYSSAPSVSLELGLGKRYEILNNGRYYPVAMKSITGMQAQIYYLGHGAEDVIDLSVASLRVIPPLEGPPPPDPHTLGPGVEVVGKYSGDGNMYDATVEEVTDFGYKLVFDAYGNSEEVPLEYIQPRVKGEKRTFGVLEDNDSYSSKKDKDFKIPDNLKILPTDTHAEQMRKRQKVKAIKAKLKQKERAEEAAAKQKSWQHFMTKGKTKKSSFLALSKKESIFKSPDTVDGKVGVTGSDRKMTEYELPKKYRFGAENNRF